MKTHRTNHQFVKSCVATMTASRYRVLSRVLGHGPGRIGPRLPVGQAIGVDTAPPRCTRSQNVPSCTSLMSALRRVLSTNGPT